MVDREPFNDIARELASDDWLEAGSAIRKLIPHGAEALAVIEPLFALTLHAKAPVASDSQALIRRLGHHAVPYLCNAAASRDAERRTSAILLLLEAGSRRATTTLLVEQKLQDRRDDIPDWKSHTDLVIDLFHDSLADPSLDVRFAAASALEELGRCVAETIPVFIDALEAGTDDQKNWAALRLGRIGPIAAQALPALRIAAQSSCRYTPRAASNAITLIASEAS